MLVSSWLSSPYRSVGLAVVGKSTLSLDLVTKFQSPVRKVRGGLIVAIV